MALRRRTWIIGGIVVGVVATFGILLAAAQVPFSSDRLRERVESALAERLDSQVTLESLTLRLAPEIHIVGTGLTVRHKGRTDVPPLISIQRFVVHTGLLALAHGHVSTVTLDGLEIEIPPPSDQTSDEQARDAQEDAARRQREANAPKESRLRWIVVDNLIADKATMDVLPRDKGAKPRVWSMHELRLHDVAADEPMPFHSLLTNGIPPGEIDISGTFGPWNAVEPGETLLNGDFTLARADLSAFKGISGNLSARGSFFGTLDTLDVSGETNTPDFAIALSRQPVPLHAKYHTIVDATNGNTTFEEIDAAFLNTALVAKGGVYDAKGIPGRFLTLNVEMAKGRIEDVMKFTINSPTAPMVGALTLHTKLQIPPGDIDVVDKLRLDGSFEIQGGRFTDRSVQQKINDLSRRASGKVKDEPPDTRTVTSNFAGSFAVAGATLRIPRVTFNIPGAVVDISGQFGLKPPQVVAFSGSLFADAKVSEMTTGFKSLLLKAIDPLFRRDGRTVVPLKISGTRSDPSFGLDMKRVFSRGN
jgi:hypothetical protein